MTREAARTLKPSAKPAEQKAPEPRLGRGLAALFGDSDMAYKSAITPTRQPQAATPATPGIPGKDLKTMPVARLQPGRYQPRRVFDELALQELSESIRTKGVLQPLLVRPVGKGSSMFEIVAGERRWHAAQRAGVHEVPVIVRDLNDKETLEIALIENIQRQDLNPLEEAEGFDRLMHEFSYTQEALAKVVGKSRSYIANILRLNGLPQNVKALMVNGSLSAGHARALVTATDPAALAESIVEGKLTVRQAEDMMRRESEAQGKPLVGRAITKAREAEKTTRRDADLLALEKDLSRTLGLSVTVAPKTAHSGSITIGYKDLDQMDMILRRLRK